MSEECSDLSDSPVWYVSEDTYAWLWEQINNPPAPKHSEKLRQAMSAKYVWETDEEHEQKMNRYRSQLDDTDC